MCRLYATNILHDFIEGSEASAHFVVSGGKWSYNQSFVY